jgi:CO dehydrogenase maturation factor
MYNDIGLIVNRAPLPEKITEKEIGGVRVISVIPQDDAMTENDIEGKSIFELPEDTGILKGAEQALTNLKII